MLEKYRSAIVIISIVVACLLIILLVAEMDAALNDTCAREQVSIAGAVSHIGVPCTKK